MGGVFGRGRTKQSNLEFKIIMHLLMNLVTAVRSLGRAAIPASKCLHCVSDNIIGSQRTRCEPKERIIPTQPSPRSSLPVHTGRLERLGNLQFYK